MSELVRVETSDGVMTITIDRPDKKNALTDAMYAVMADALVRADADDAVRAVLLRGEGGVFTAGNDLNDFMAVASTGGDITQAAAFRFITVLAETQTPCVAAVTGLAVGIGLTMLLHCDLVYVAEDARLSVPFVNLGLVPEAASSLLIPGIIGHRRAFALFALGETLTGAQAAQLGLANAALPALEVLPKAQAAADALAKRAPASLRETKRLMRDAEGLKSQIQAENQAFAQRLKSDEAREAFAAFLEKRPPRF